MFYITERKICPTCNMLFSFSKSEPRDTCSPKCHALLIEKQRLLREQMLSSVETPFKRKITPYEMFADLAEEEALV